MESRVKTGRKTRVLRIIAMLLIVSLVFTGQLASASIYYVGTVEEESIGLNLGRATGKDFKLVYVDMEMVEWDKPHAVQEYANSGYLLSDTGWIGRSVTTEYKKYGEITGVDVSVKHRETPKEREYVYETIRKMIRGNKNIIKGSNYDKARWAYDWIVDNVEYDYNFENATAYKGLTDSTVCNGYAMLYYAFATELGLDCYIVEGTAGEDGGYHAWNVVKMEDGKWYYIDPTWGVSSRETYFMKSYKSFKVHEVYKEFVENLDLATTDYINTGNSGNSGVLASVFNVDMGVVKRNILVPGEKHEWLVENKDNVELKFISEDDSIATVSKNGVITAKGIGITTITVLNEELGIEQKFVADVRKENTKSRIEKAKAKEKKERETVRELKAKNISVKYGKTVNIKLEVTPKTAKLQDVKYKSKDKSIATVSKDGKVKGVKAGTTTIEITDAGGKKTVAKVTVKPAIENSKEYIVVKNGQKIDLSNVVKISKNGYKDLVFKTTNKKVATISSKGILVGKGNGNCEIRIYDKLTNKKLFTIYVSNYKEININEL